MSKRIVTFAEIILHLAPNGYCRFFQDDQPQATFGGDSFGGGLIYALLSGCLLYTSGTSCGLRRR